MFQIVVSLFFIINLSLSLENTTTIEPVTKITPTKDHILCRNCGASISTSNYIFPKKSQDPQYVYKETLFGKKDVLVQVLRSEVFFSFPVITSGHSTCITIGEWEVSELWFPGYHWKYCMCPECGTYIGYQFSDNIPPTLTMTTEKISPEDKEYLDKCEEEFKHRFTENDKEFMKVFNSDPSIPPIVDSWWVPNNSGRRNDRRDNRRNHSYERYGNRDRNRDFYDRRDRDNYSRGYNDYNQDDNTRGYRNQRPRHY